MIVKHLGTIKRLLSVVIATMGFVAISSLAGAAGRSVDVAQKPGANWEAMPTRILEDVPGLNREARALELTQYGGLANAKRQATGFFRVEKIDARWWLIDPDGGRFVYRGVASVRTTSTPGAEAALEERFADPPGWAAGTARLLQQHGFNGLGGWSNADGFKDVQPRLAYTKIWNFMSSYGKIRGGTFQQPGHTGYPRDCIFVFDPEFETFCDEHARQLEAGRNDPWLLGHYSDNELPFPRTALTNYLQLPPADTGHQAALRWLRERRGTQNAADQITERDEAAFQAAVVERYFRIVAGAIKKHDPNHLYLGARFYGADLRWPEVFRACGPHVDVVSVNYYRAWTPAPDRLAMWEKESGKPVIITEWYAKGVDSGMANTGGAGWLVKTQRDRGWFYQNFALALLESRVCVGWDWFKYMDNDPADKKVDPSNRDSNKGIVNNRYVPYQPLLGAMKEINDRAFALVEHFDRERRPAAGQERTGK